MARTPSNVKKNAASGTKKAMAKIATPMAAAR